MILVEQLIIHLFCRSIVRLLKYINFYVTVTYVCDGYCACEFVASSLILWSNESLGESVSLSQMPDNGHQC